MQLVVAPTSEGLESFLLEAEASEGIASIRRKIATRLGTDPARLRLVFEGVELPDGPSAEACMLRNLCTVRCVVTPEKVPPSSASVSAEAGGATPGTPVKHRAAPASDSDAADAATFVSNAELGCSVVVTGVPEGAAEATHAALVDAFSSYGAIQRIVSQGDAEPQDASADPAHPVTQHAVIVFAREESAAAALAYDHGHILGARVRVCLASSLESTEDAPDAEGSSGVEVLSGWLAAGLTMGRRGAANVQEFSQRHGVADAVRDAMAAIADRAGRFDARYRVSETVSARALAVNERYSVTERAAAAAHAVGAAVSGAADRAMQHTAVQRGVTAVSGAAARVGAVLGDIGAKALAKADAAPGSGRAVEGVPLSDEEAEALLRGDALAQAASDGDERGDALRAEPGGDA